MPAPGTQANRVPSSRAWLPWTLRIAGVGLALWASGWLLHRLADRESAGGKRPGFVAGVAHGALMPMALPRLLIGSDVTIYAGNNTGRTYKLGYTCGVNACGAIFFGLFWRRWGHRFGNRTP